MPVFFYSTEALYRLFYWGLGFLVSFLVLCSEKDTVLYFYLGYVRTFGANSSIQLVTLGLGEVFFFHLYACLVVSGCFSGALFLLNLVCFFSDGVFRSFLSRLTVGILLSLVCSCVHVGFFRCSFLAILLDFFFVVPDGGVSIMPYLSLSRVMSIYSVVDFSLLCLFVVFVWVFFCGSLRMFSSLRDLFCLVCFLFLIGEVSLLFSCVLMFFFLEGSFLIRLFVREGSLSG